jgi:predicted nucleic-acid-binding Zn-ribbon protein
MNTPCPECGSVNVISDLYVFSGEAPINDAGVYVSMVEPEPAGRPFIWAPKSTVTGFFAVVCGDCGYTRFYTKRHAELLKAARQGYTGEKPSFETIPYTNTK